MWLCVFNCCLRTSLMSTLCWVLFKLPTEHRIWGGAAKTPKGCLCGSPWKALQRKGDVSVAVGWWLQAKDDFKNLYFSLFKPADNCWSVCALLQLAPSSACSMVVMLLAVHELINLDRGTKSPWGSRSRCSSGALGYLLQSLPWCTLQLFYQIYIEMHFSHSS